MANVTQWAAQLDDQRSKKVIFLSHCLLNENTRYLGGACRPGAIYEILHACLERGYGIVQPCPEQHAWGGVLKRRLLAFLGSEGTLRFRVRRILLPFLLAYTRQVYRKLAKQVVREIEDYSSSGFSVVAIVGVDGSPSCGVCKTLDVRRSLEHVGRLHQTAHGADMNAIVLASLIDGEGIFTRTLHKELDRRKLRVPFLAHDLMAELRGDVVTPGI
jgi:predicted secreted protein